MMWERFLMVRCSTLVRASLTKSSRLFPFAIEASGSYWVKLMVEIP